MDYDKTIEDIIFEQEAAELMALGSLYEKQLMMESYYMEEETPSAGEAPTVDNVNAFVRFVNWIGRIITSIRTRIRKWFSDKKIKAIYNQIDKIGEGITIPSITVKRIYDLHSNIMSGKSGITEVETFDPKGNYQKMAELWNSNLKEYNKFNNDLINVDNGTKTIASKGNAKSSLKKIIDMTSEIIDRLSKIAEKSNEIIKKQKEQLNDEIVKSNNFKQWTLCVSRCATYCFKMISTLTKAMSNIVDNRNSTDSIRVIDVPGTLSYDSWKDYTKSVLDRNSTKGNGQLLWIKLSLPIKLNEISDPTLKKLLSMLDYDVPSGWMGLDDNRIPLVDRLNSFSNIRNVCLIGYVYDKSTDKGNQTVTIIAEAIDKKIDEIIMDEKNNINNIEITGDSPLKEYKDAKDVEVDLTNLTNETLEKCNEFYAIWVNKSDEKYQNWAWNTIVDDKNKDFDDFNYMIAYIPADVKTGKWRRWKICTPKNSLSDSVLETFFHGGKLERNSLSGGGKAFSKTIRKKK